MDEFFELSLGFYDLDTSREYWPCLYETFVRMDLFVVSHILIESLHLRQGHQRGTEALFSVSLLWRACCQSVLLPVLSTLSVAKVEVASSFLDRDIFTLVTFAFQRDTLRV